MPKLPWALPAWACPLPKLLYNTAFVGPVKVQALLTRTGRKHNNENRIITVLGPN